MVLLVIGAGLEALLLYFADSSATVTAFRTSVMDVLAEACPDFRRWWCMESGLDLVLVAGMLDLENVGTTDEAGSETL